MIRSFRIPAPGRAAPGAMRRRTGLRRLLAVAALLAGLFPAVASADLTGRQDQRAAVAGRSDAALIAANPVLRQVQRVRPSLLPEILRRLRAPVATRDDRMLERPDPGPAQPPPPEQGQVLEENPDLGQLHRESPEAALDLLRLIREATRKR